MFNFTFQMFSFIEKIFSIFTMVYHNIFGNLYSPNLYDQFIKNIMRRTWFRGIPFEEEKNYELNTKIKVGLLTNEIPPIVYGGVATWIVNFIKMFENDENVEVIPIFLAYNDKLPESCLTKYKNIRVINTEEDIKGCFDDIDVCVNNLWIALETIQKIKELFPVLSHL